MDQETKDKLAAFSARFRATRQATEKAKIDAKLAKESVKERKEINRKFHIVNVNPEKGTPLQRGEADATIAAHAAALRTADDANWTPIGIVVTGQWQVCRCCEHEAVATSGIFFREKHNTIPSARRLRHIGRIIDGFDVEVALEGVELTQCVKCIKGTRVDELLEAVIGASEMQLSNQMELFRV